jgi:hypothetical protein
MPEDTGDLLSDLLNDEINEENNADLLPSADDFRSLQKQVETLEKEKQGLLAATKEERRKRQAASERMASLEGAVTGILSQRQQQGMESLSEAESADARRQGIPVKYDDDGNAWVDPNSMAEILSPYEQQIRDLEAKLQQTNSTASALDEAERIRQSIIGEDERYGAAAGKYRAARRWVEDAVIDFVKANNVNRSLQSGEALKYVFDAQLRKEFSDQFDGLDIVDIVIAEDSEDLFRRALVSISSTMTPADTQTPKEEGMDSRFRKVLNKPSALGNNANAKAGSASVLEKVGNMGTADIMELSDAQIEALLKLSAREEKSDGIKF